MPERLIFFEELINQFAREMVMKAQQNILPKVVSALTASRVSHSELPCLGFILSLPMPVCSEPLASRAYQAM